MANNEPRQITSANQTDKSSLWSAMSLAFRQHAISSDGLLPARIVSYDRKKNTAVVRPSIQIVKMDDTIAQRAPLANIPVLSMGGGNFHISFPLKAGDLAWIFASDRDMSLFMQDLKDAAPPNGRIKSFASGLVIPDVFRQYTVAEEDSEAMVIQSLDGATKISIRNDNIKITAPARVLVDTALAEFSKDVVVKGKTTLEGGLEATGGAAVSLPAQTTIGSIQVSSHGHEQNGDSGRTSGGMLE